MVFSYSSGSSVLYQSGCWGRVEVVHYALSFFVSLAHSYPQVHNVLCKDQTFPQWLKRLTLEAPEVNEIYQCNTIENIEYSYENMKILSAIQIGSPSQPQDLCTFVHPLFRNERFLLYYT